MFGFFRRAPAKNYRRLDDVVWMSAAARQSGVTQRVLALCEQGTPVVLVTFSLSDQGAFRPALADVRGVQLADATRIHAAGLVPLAAAGRLPRVIVAGLSPTPAADAQLLQRIDDPRLKGIEIEFHSSLDDPLLRPLISPKLRDLLGQLGLGPDEPIQHPMVTRAIARARAKHG